MICPNPSCPGNPNCPENKNPHEFDPVQGQNRFTGKYIGDMVICPFCSFKENARKFSTDLKPKEPVGINMTNKMPFIQQTAVSSVAPRVGRFIKKSILEYLNSR